MGRKRTGPGPNAPERNRQFAEHLSALMQSAGLTAPEVASRMGRSRSEVYQYLVGQHLPRLEMSSGTCKSAKSRHRQEFTAGRLVIVRINSRENNSIFLTL